MAVAILTENSILVYDFVRSRSQMIPFEKTIRVHHYTCARSLSAFLGETVQKDEPKPLNRMVNMNQSVRQCRIGLESFQNLHGNRIETNLEKNSLISCAEIILSEVITERV